MTISSPVEIRADDLEPTRTARALRPDESPVREVEQIRERGFTLPEGLPLAYYYTVPYHAP